jgi:hypothetical protein
MSHGAPATFKPNAAHFHYPWRHAAESLRPLHGQAAFRTRRALDKMETPMRSRRQSALFAITVAAFLACATCAFAQSGVTHAGVSAADRAATADGAVPSQAPGMLAPAPDASDQTLEISPRIVPPPPAASPAPQPRTDATGDDATAPADGANGDANASIPGAGGIGQPAAASNPHRPYLGIAVQTIYSNDRPGGVVAGLEVVSVDPGSPAETAGLRGRTKMTSLGESGATAGALVPPLNLFVMPLLKKTGSLGQGGDLIIAIDDRRVLNDFDLQSELAALKPGDLIYFSVVRTMADGSHKTLKLPIKLGDADSAVAQPGASSDAPPPAISGATAPTHP